jgi:hypothetical protein
LTGTSATRRRRFEIRRRRHHHRRPQTESEPIDEVKMNEATTRPDGRTHYEAVLDVRFGVHFNGMCERYYNSLDSLIGTVSLIGGSAAAVSFVNKSADIAATAGLVLAVIAIVERLLNAARKAEQHGAAKRAYGDLDAKAGKLSLAQVDAELRSLQASAPSGIRSLLVPAFNANLRSAGREEFVRPEAPLSKLATLLA